jgi:hypothetical protein
MYIFGWSPSDLADLSVDHKPELRRQMDGKRKGTIAEHFFRRL